MGVTEFLSTGLIEIYNAFLSSLPNWAQNFLTLFLLVILVAIYAIFIWHFYRKAAKKNILNLDLNKYNKSENPATTKFLAAIFYFIEYIILVPLYVFLWFAIFTLFLILPTDGLELSSPLIISATIIAAIRMTAYYKEDLSKEIAKLLPFTLLAISITRSGFFDISRILSHLTNLPSFMSQIFTYLAFIIALEIVLRIFEFIFSFFELKESPKIENKK